ncbi:MAG TPA: hypothetical protein DG753_00895 [Clostridium sp.]|nr:hypothetical protein [Clostridium sp.]
MKNYIKNKGFVPENFITKVQNNNFKNEKKILLVLLCFNLIYLPLNINSLYKSHDKHVEKLNIESYSDKKDLHSRKIYNIAEVLFSDDVKECDVTSNGGSIVVQDIMNVNKISDKKVLKVKEVELKHDGCFELKVDNYE